MSLDTDTDRSSIAGQRERWPTAAAPALAGLFGFAMTIYFFYPGFMVWDSTWQFQQAVTGEINNAHPPIMARLWSLTNRVLYGPAGMLALQSAGYWTGLALIARHAANSMAVRVALVLGMGFFPPLLGILATIWKDSGSLATLLMAGGLLLEARRRRSTTLALLTLPFVFYALAVRFNNLLTVLPLLWWISRTLTETLPNRPVGRRPMLTTAALFFALIATLSSLAYAANTVGVRRHAYFVAVPLWDLSQISLRIDELIVPDVAITGKGLDLPRLREISRPYRCDYDRTRRGGEVSQDIEWTHLSSGDAQQILTDWFAAVFQHPREYLDHRLGVTSAALFYPHFGRTGDRARRSIFGAQRIASIAGFHHPFKFSERPGYSALRQIFNSSAESVLCRPWIYMVIAIGVWLYGRWRRSEEFLIAGSFASSGLLSVLPLFVIAPSTDFRYSVWLVASALVAAILMVSLEVRTRRS